MDHSGLLIAIEGTDESNVATAVSRLRDELIREGYDVASFNFPQIEQPSGYFVQQYQAGTYGPSAAVGPYNAALLFAMDHFQTAAAIREALSVGQVVIVHKFVGANMAEQGIKFNHPEERRGFFIWLDNAEFQMLGIPRPDRTIVLRTPATEQSRLVEVYDDLCQLFPKDFTRLDAARGDVMMDNDTLHRLVRETINPLLPTLPATTAKQPQYSPNYYIPTTLNTNTRKKYQEQMDELINIHSQIIQEAGKIAPPELLSAINKVLPVAIIENSKAVGTNYIEQDSTPEHNLPETLAPQAHGIKLFQFTPRNELDLASHALYRHSNLPLRNIASEIANWTYERKLKVLQTALIDPVSAVTILELATYNWDLVTSFETFHHFAEQHVGTALEWQPLTPRYGYEVPESIEEAGLTELFEACFDLSLNLYSLLQAAGYQREAQYATLQGHRLRWKVIYTAQELAQSVKPDTGSLEQQAVIKQMRDKIAEVHPILVASRN